MKKSIKIMYIFIMLILLISIIFPNYSKATGSEESANSGLSWSEIENSAKAFLQKGKNQDTLDETKLQNIVIPIAQILVAVGNIVVVIALAIMAIKYMISNPDDKAKLKTQLVGLFVATIVIFGAQFIWKVLTSLFETF